MSQLRFLTAGESHGIALTGIIEGIPSGLTLSAELINKELARRQKGYGRGGRMKIESDEAEILSGVRWGLTTGSPVTLRIANRDWLNWERGMSAAKADAGAIPPVVRPRPGHADLAGALKYNLQDIRNVLERSSARETAMRVALGAVAKQFLTSAFGVRVGSFVIQIGTVRAEKPEGKVSPVELVLKAEESDVRCFDEMASVQMKALIDTAKEKGDSLGGMFEIFATGLVPGLGSHIQWDTKLDGRLAQAIMSIQAIKAVEIGDGMAMAGQFGSQSMDEIFYDSTRNPPFYRKTNHAGGLEGGMTNGMPLIIRAAMKPVPTLRQPLNSIDLVTKEPIEAAYERSDICAVPAASVIGEAMTALVLAQAFVEKFGGDSLKEVRHNYMNYLEYLKNF
jgi:chorismate synthase